MELVVLPLFLLVAMWPAVRYRYYCCISCLRYGCPTYPQIIERANGNGHWGVPVHYSFCRLNIAATGGAAGGLWGGGGG